MEDTDSLFKVIQVLCVEKLEHTSASFGTLTWREGKLYYGREYQKLGTIIIFYNNQFYIAFYEGSKCDTFQKHFKFLTV